ncbi:MAG TPA: hypothetical protein VGD21_09060 [Lysobacter sp.]
MAVHDARGLVHTDDPESGVDRRAARRSRARRAALRYLAVWSWVAAMALIAQAFAPSVS